MKKIITAIAGAFLATSAMATTFLDNPSIEIAGTTYGFDLNSSAEGICRAMGFSHYVSGSIESKLDGMVNIAYVNSQGKVKGMVANAGVTEVVTSIGCDGQNSGGGSAVEGTVISNPSMTINGAEYSFDENSSADGVCRALGFRSAVRGLEIYDTTAFPNIVYVKFNGEVFAKRQNLGSAVVLKQVSCK